MNKLPLKKIIMTFHHNQEKLWFFTVKTVEMYDVATVAMKSVVAKSIDEAIERLKMYFNTLYEISPDNIIVKKEPNVQTLSAPAEPKNSKNFNLSKNKIDKSKSDDNSGKEGA